jgi:ubiquitin C-terminal hydrolase
LKPLEISDYTCSKCTIKNIIHQINKITPGSSEEIKKFSNLKLYLEKISQNNVNQTLEMLVKGIVDFCDENGISEILSKLKLNPIKTNLKQRSKIIKYPKILTVHIQKVFFEENMYTNKLKIIFPEKLNFQHKDETNGIIKEIKYELISFIEHFGTHNFGHYIAYRKFFDKWFQLNDWNVKLIEKKYAFEVSNPYMLFYRQIE